MIRVIGLNEAVFDDIIANYYDLVRDYHVNSKTIIFKSCCEIYTNKTQTKIYCGDESVVFLCCDYWRIEIF